jgi:hypothetical protein
LLWLDRIDTFTTGGELTAAMLRRLHAQSPGLRVVATINSNQYEVWATAHHSIADMFRDPVELERLRGGGCRWLPTPVRCRRRPARDHSDARLAHGGNRGNHRFVASEVLLQM